jgi:hypothetical protein
VIFATGALNTNGTRLQATVSIRATAAARVSRSDGHAKSNPKIA